MSSSVPSTGSIDSTCPGYIATNIKTTSSALTANLVLGGTACNVHGADLEHLQLSVVYEDGGFATSPLPD